MWTVASLPILEIQKEGIGTRGSGRHQRADTPCLASWIESLVFSLVKAGGAQDGGTLWLDELVPHNAQYGLSSDQPADPRVVVSGRRVSPTLAA